MRQLMEYRTVAVDDSLNDYDYDYFIGKGRNLNQLVAEGWQVAAVMGRWEDELRGWVYYTLLLERPRTAGGEVL